MYREIIARLMGKKLLKKEHISFFLSASEKGILTSSQQAAVLTALSVKGIEGIEVFHFAQCCLEKMPFSFYFPEAIDICGTGGSGLPRINTSTLAAFILSTLNIPVAKHGNKAASGRFGSFDLLEKLGINIAPEPEALKIIAKDYNLAFLFARTYHPLFKHFSSVRSELGFPTIFNLLGPLLNPARTKKQIIGTSSKKNALLIAEAAKKLRKKKVFIVCGEDGLDEVTLTGKTNLLEVSDGKIKNFSLTPSSFGIKPANFSEIDGGDAKKNTEIALEILQGTCKSRHLDLVLVNVALAIKLSGMTKNLKKAYQIAKKAVESGKVYEHFLAYKKASHLPLLLLKIVRQKKKEIEERKKMLPITKIQKTLQPSNRNFKTALELPGISLIAEIKKASPTEGVLRKHFSAESLAKIYETFGARALSVVTDKTFFQGSLENLKKTKEVTFLTPLLLKDFVLDEYQIYEARYYCADAILLIARLLSFKQIKHFLELIKALNMHAVCEVHTKEEVEMVLEAGAEIIGINNRDLSNFTIDLNVTKQLSQMIPQDILVIAESGIKNKTDIKKLSKHIDAVLIGTTLVTAKNPGKKIIELMGKRKPLLKCCGIRSLEAALLCQKLQIPFIGLNFVPSSYRKISYQLASQIVKALKKQKKSVTKTVGVFQNQSIEEINEAAESIGFDFVQLSGEETMNEVQACKRPVIKGISISKPSDLKKAEKMLHARSSILLDSQKPGSGKTFDHRLLKKIHFPYFLAGGINLRNLKSVIKDINPYGIDIASGIETEGEEDLQKIKTLAHLISS